jgi:hypothetical protein
MLTNLATSQKALRLNSSLSIVLSYEPKINLNIQNPTLDIRYSIFNRFHPRGAARRHSKHRTFTFYTYAVTWKG